MQINQSDIVRGVATGLALVAGGTVVVIPFLFWGSSHAPEFFGAFTAAIVAAVAVVLGAHYQASLTRQRDDEIRKRDQTGEILELYFWLGHASQEMEFIADILDRMKARMAVSAQTKLPLPLQQFREITSSAFMDELLERAKAASKLPVDVSSVAVHVLYGTYTEADRIYRHRGATEDYHPPTEILEKYASVAHARAKKLEAASKEIELYLCTTKGMGRFFGG